MSRYYEQMTKLLGTRIVDVNAVITLLEQPSFFADLFKSKSRDEQVNILWGLFYKLKEKISDSESLKIAYQRLIQGIFAHYANDTLSLQRITEVLVFELQNDEYSEMVYLEWIKLLGLSESILSIQYPQDQDKIANGAFCVVYQGEIPSEQGNVKGAFKLPLDKDKKQHEQVEEQSLIFYEVAVLQKLQESPYIIRLKNMFKIKDVPGVYGSITTYAAKGTLHNVLYPNNKALSTLTPADKITVAFQVASGLEYMHQQGYFHRDVKPSNIVLNENNQAMLIDFGTAIAKGVEDNKKEDCVATIAYAPFEELLKQRKDFQKYGMKVAAEWYSDVLLGFTEKSDVYSLGMVIWELASAKGHPFNGFQLTLQSTNKPNEPKKTEIKKVVGDAITMLIFLYMQPNNNRPDPTPLGELHPALTSLITRAWRLRPQERPSMDEMVKKLGEMKNVNCQV